MTGLQTSRSNPDPLVDLAAAREAGLVNAALRGIALLAEESCAVLAHRITTIIQ
jgi:hypothetical protein